MVRENNQKRQELINFFTEENLFTKEEITNILDYDNLTLEKIEEYKELCMTRHLNHLDAGNKKESEAYYDVWSNLYTLDKKNFGGSE